MSVERNINIFKKPWVYIVFVFLVLTTILLSLYVIPHKLSVVVPTKDIEYVVLLPETNDDKRIDGAKVEEFIKLIKDANVVTYPKWAKQMRWGYNTPFAVYYKNGKVIKFGEHRWYKDNTYGDFKVNTFDFEAAIQLFV